MTSPIAQAIARNGDALAVDRHVTVADELASREHGRHELGAIDERVEAALEQADQMLRRRALQARSLIIGGAELALGNRRVIAFELLLGFELLAEVRQLALAAFAVLAGTALAAVERALRAAPDVLAEAAVDLMLGANALRHLLALHELEPRQVELTDAAVERPLLCPH